jgi:hypothetical protein
VIREVWVRLLVRFGVQTLSSMIRESEVHDSVQSQSSPSQANSIPMTNLKATSPSKPARE